MEPLGSNTSNNTISPKYGLATLITQLRLKYTRISLALLQLSIPKPDYKAICYQILYYEAYKASISTITLLTPIQHRFLTKLSTLNLSTISLPPKLLVGLIDQINIIQSKLGSYRPHQGRLRLTYRQYAITLRLRIAATQRPTLLSISLLRTAKPTFIYQQSRQLGQERLLQHSPTQK